MKINKNNHVSMRSLKYNDFSKTVTILQIFFPEEAFK